MPKEQKKRSRRLLRTIPYIAVLNIFLVLFGDIRPETLEAAFGSRAIVWFYATGSWTAIVLLLYFATRNVGKTNAEIEAEK